ncbi:hypothetical protein [Pseudoxanthomonas sp. PXM02]|uniref:hypothetical protein n=1 Tax=Pseudoxanthomonas sp. PXM02 TaxID=2769294 RepID=UPI00177B9167|nr:hypothetical protein [Pseudoxanthomonas sp. PXM02]MBD9478845.1 hypothetical protein [Pseudoxanthomonas sp. PXM02]
MSVIPSHSSTSVPIHRITCNGMPLPATSQLIALDTTQAIDRIGTATLRFVAVAADRTWDDLLREVPLGAMLEIALGHGAQADTVFIGTVHAHRLLLADGGAPEIVLDAATPSAFSAASDDVTLTAQYGATLRALDVERSLDDAGAIRLQGQAILAGTARALPGNRLALQGVADAFGGTYYIDAVHHHVDREGWMSRFDVRADAR